MKKAFQETPTLAISFFENRDSERYSRSDVSNNDKLILRVCVPTCIISLAFHLLFGPRAASLLLN